MAAKVVVVVAAKVVTAVVVAVAMEAVVAAAKVVVVVVAVVTVVAKVLELKLMAQHLAINKKAPPKPKSGGVGEYDGKTYKKDGRVWTGDEAKKMLEYDQKRYSDDPEERLAAASLGKEAHKNKWDQQLKANNEAARTRIPDKIGTMKNGVYTTPGGRRFTGADAQNALRYDQLRTSQDPAQRAKAEAFGKKVHDEKWKETLDKNNEDARNRPSTRKVGTTNEDGSYTTADGSRTFDKGPHADINRKYDELLAEGKTEEAEKFGKEMHDKIGKCKNTGYFFH